MCIGVPMQLQRIQAQRGHALGRDGPLWVDLRLVGPCRVGDWLLVFQGAARERLEPARAAEIDAALDLLEAAQRGALAPDADPGFELPSTLSAQALAALAGRALP